MLQIKSSNSQKLPRTAIFLASALALLATQAQADNVPPADTYVQQYTGEYPLATTESVTTFNKVETEQYKDAQTHPAQGAVAPGYETAAQATAAGRNATTEAGSTQPEIVNVDAAYTPAVPIFVNKQAASDVALDRSVTTDLKAPAGYYTQFGAFGSLDNAARLRAKLTAQLQKPAVIIEDRGLYKVQVGPMQTSSEAFGLQEGHPEKLGFVRR